MVVAQTQWQSQGQASGKPGDALHRLLMEAGWSYAQISALAGPRRVEGQAEAARAWRNDEHGARSSNPSFRGPNGADYFVAAILAAKRDKR